MSRRYLGACVALVALAVAQPGFAQSSANGSSGSGAGSGSGGAGSGGSGSSGTTAEPMGPMTSDQAAASVQPSTQLTAMTDRSLLLNYRGHEVSIGWRIWAMWVPAQIVNIFAKVAPGWPGPVVMATGPELIYRSDGLDIALAAMYVNYTAAPGFFRGANADAGDEELVTSYLYGLYITAHLMWGIHIAKVFEIQIGAGLGVGYIGGDLYRSQAYPDGTDATQAHVTDATVWHDCGAAGGPGGAHPGFCDPAQSNHFTNNHFTESSFFSGGSLPTIIPWLSLPQIALHFRPARNFDFKLEGGYALIGVYGGGSIHIVF